MLRAGVFLSVFGAMAVWEAIAPRRRQPGQRWRRWPSNLGIVVLNTLILRLVFPLGAVGVATWVHSHGWGVLPALALPGWCQITASLIALDLLIYGQHWAFHAIPLFWRLHRMHHADTELDVTSGGRFHPIEIMLSLAIKLAAILALGIPPVAVLIFEILLNATAMFNHSNVALPLWADRVLRLLVVTPDMHRVHHSIVPQETDSNFGFNLPWWDHLFGTYRAQPKAGHTGMTIGLAAFRTPIDQRLDRMLVQPLRKAK
jgi:sterol desaturase/sphingolipid hydroxylase (fatty acid hydroxylase superfamily)